MYLCISNQGKSIANTTKRHKDEAGHYGAESRDHNRRSSYPRNSARLWFFLCRKLTKFFDDTTFAL
jgi:hypothetical protein